MSAEAEAKRLALMAKIDAMQKSAVAQAIQEQQKSTKEERRASKDALLKPLERPLERVSTKI